MYPTSIYSDYFNRNEQQKLSNQDAVLLTKSIRDSDYAKIDHLISKFGKQILQQTFECGTGKRSDGYTNIHTVFEYIDPNNFSNFKKMVHYLIGNGADMNMPKFPDLSNYFTNNPDIPLKFDNYVDSIMLSDFKSPTPREQLHAYGEMLDFLTSIGAKFGFTSCICIVEFLIDETSYADFGKFILPRKDKVTSATPLKISLDIKERKFEFFKSSKSQESFLYKFPKEVIAKILNSTEYCQIDTRKVFEDKFKAKCEKVIEREVLFLAALQDTASEVFKLPRELVLEILHNRMRI